MASFLLLAGCGGSDTKEVETSASSSVPRSSTSTQPADAAMEGLTETLMKMGLSRSQARCIVEKMDDVSADIGDPNALSEADQTLIEDLLSKCAVSGG